MDMITVSAKTLDEAITKALLELKTTSDHLYYEVVDKGSSGLLGFLGAKPVVIQARIREEHEEVISKKPVKSEKSVKEEKPAEIVKSVSGERTTEQVKNNVTENIPKSEDAVKESKPKKPVNVDEELIKTKSIDFLNQMFRAMDMKVDVEASYDAEEGELSIIMNGDEMGILIGKRGQTLDSMQYLVSLVVNKETEGYIRVKLDTENYRDRRKATLETLAKNISYKVKRTKHPVSLEPMNPYERRIIHSALQNDKFVTTRSEGEDPYRHVVISLKRDEYKKDGYKKDGYKKDGYKRNK